MNDWREEMSGLASAEEFFEFLDVEFDPAVVRVNRLHILQRFHDYLGKDAPAQGLEFHRAALRRAYADFVHSDARTEKVFKVFRSHPQVAFVPIGELRRRT